MNNMILRKEFKMLHPSYAELMERINKDVEEGATPVVQSRYSIVKATANRAKQIIEARALEEKVSKLLSTGSGDQSGQEATVNMSKEDIITLRKGEPLIAYADERKPLSVAVDELYDGYLTLTEDSEG